MDYNEIKKLMDDMGNSKLDSLEIEFPDGVKISMTKNSNKKEEKIESNNLVNISNNNETKTTQIIPATENDENYKIVKSPMVGTFYASSSPDKDPFVNLGDKVKKGQVLCIVEAMKLMNEIESEFDGEIVEICVKNEEIVEYGTPLFKIK